MTFYKSKTLYTNSSTLDQGFDSTNHLLVKEDPILMKYNEEYYHPLYLKWEIGRDIWDPRNSMPEVPETQPVASDSTKKFAHISSNTNLL